MELMMSTASVTNQLISQIEQFYGLERKIIEEEPYNVYCVPSASYPWTNALLKSITSEDMKHDADGMLLFEVELFLLQVCSYIDESFIRRWIVDDELKIIECFTKTLKNHPLHQQMITGGYLIESYSTHTDRDLQQYLNMLCNAFDIVTATNNLLNISPGQNLGSEENHTQSVSISEVVTAAKNATSPQAVCYLPTPYQILTIRSDQFARMLNEKACEVLKKSDHDFHFDMWLEVWRIHCITKK